jgi:diguanylate cyclase (GGDEF)-like protein
VSGRRALSAIVPQVRDTAGGLEPERIPFVASELSLEAYRRLVGVYESILSEHEPRAVQQRIAETLAELVPYDLLTIYTLGPEDEWLHAALVSGQGAGRSKRRLKDYRMPRNAGITGWAVERQEPVMSNDAQLDARAQLVPGTKEREESVMVIPLIVQQQVIGTLNIRRFATPVGRFAAHHFDGYEFELAQRFASAAALGTSNAESRAVIARQASTDDLTGLANRRAFLVQIERELSVSRRTGLPVSVLVIDGNRLKSVNDTYGHAAGDELIRALAGALRDRLRLSDFAARLGGDEFALLLPATAAAGAEHLGAELSKHCESVQVVSQGAVIGATVSVGAATFDGHESADALLSRADRRMYDKKAART